MGTPAAADEFPVQVRGRQVTAGEDGFTIIEVLVALVLMTVGLFALIGLIDRSSSTTARNLNREAATNVARDITERAHAVAYANLTAAAAPGTLRDAIDPAPRSRNSTTPSGGSWTMQGRRTGETLTVTVAACTVPMRAAQPIVITATDTFCTNPTPTPSPTPTPTPTPVTGSSGGCQISATGDPQLGVRIQLLVDVSLCTGGALAAAVCTLLGPTAPLEAFLAPLVGQDGAVNVLLNGLGGGVGTTLCGGRPVVTNTVLTGAQTPARRITTTVSWTGRDPGSVTQTTVVPQP